MTAAPPLHLSTVCAVSCPQLLPLTQTLCLQLPHSRPAAAPRRREAARRPRNTRRYWRHSCGASSGPAVLMDSPSLLCHPPAPHTARLQSADWLVVSDASKVSKISAEARAGTKKEGYSFNPMLRRSQTLEAHSGGMTGD